MHHSSVAQFKNLGVLLGFLTKSTAWIVVELLENTMTIFHLLHGHDFGLSHHHLLPELIQ
jgi:hypothetical protein